MATLVTCDRCGSADRAQRVSLQYAATAARHVSGQHIASKDLCHDCLQALHEFINRKIFPKGDGA